MPTDPPASLPAPAPAPPAATPFQVAGVVVAVVALLIGVPVFLQTPPWCDLTLYQLAARNLLTGGVLYRDIFDTNLPGFVWALTAVQAVFGESVIAVRAIDLAVVGGIAAVLARHVGDAGGTPATRAWFAAGVALYYPFTSEFSHAQRDVWMLLPALAAFRLRLAGRAPFAEGLLWGCAVWVKPHVVVPAFAVWLVSAVARRPGRPVGTLPVLAGGSLLGLVGVAGLVASGAWPGFVEVFTVWNPEYTAFTFEELPQRVTITFNYFPPWSLVHVVAIPAAVVHLIQARRANPVARPRAFLAALYLGWLGQAFVLQRALEYVHVPETLLAIAVLGAYRVPVGLVGGLALAAQGVLFAAGLGTVAAPSAYFPLEIPRIANPAILAAWPDCFGPNTPDLRDRLREYPVHCVPTWTDLAAVEAYLRAVEPPLRDGELLTFHDSPHPLYLSMHLRPATRYLHFSPVLSIRSQQPRVAAEVRAAAPRYVVSDTMRSTWVRGVERDPDAAGGQAGLPRWFPLSQRGRFPWDQPIVFRSGRYFVHRIDRPIGDVDVPSWYDLGTLGPGEPTARP